MKKKVTQWGNQRLGVIWCEKYDKEEVFVEQKKQRGWWAVKHRGRVQRQIKGKMIRWRRSVDIEREAESQSLCVCVSVEWREFERTRRENSGRDNACLLYSSWCGTILLFVFLSLPLLLLQLFGCHHFLYYPSSLCFFLNLTPFAYLTNYLLILH